MTDVVVKLLVQAGEEAQRFGDYVSNFISSLGAEAEEHAKTADAPFVIIRSEPQRDCDFKVVIFQQRRAARAFSRGWSRVQSPSPQTV